MTQTAVFDALAGTNTKVSQITVPTFTSNVWKSSWVDVSAYRRLTGGLFMNQALASNGFLIEQSNSTSPTGDSDAHYWTYSNEAASLNTNPVTSVTGYIDGISVERIYRYARLVVKHNGTEPTTFRAVLIGAGIT